MDAIFQYFLLKGHKHLKKDKIFENLSKNVQKGRQLRVLHILIHLIFAFQEISIKFVSEVSTRNYAPLADLAVKGVLGLSKCIKKGKFVTKISFLIMLNEVLKSCEK